MTQRVAVIGAGLAGLSCARVLRRAGFFVEVFEQDRIIGGRMATTRVGLAAFDHGAQYITARAIAFRTFIEELQASGYVARWTPRASKGGEAGAGQMMPWYVGTPGMSSIVRPLAESVRIHTSRRVHTIEKHEKGWHVWFEDETSVAPPRRRRRGAGGAGTPAARPFLDELADHLARVRMLPLLGADGPLGRCPAPKRTFSDCPDTIRWIARDSTKPGRNSRGENLVIHASQNWSRELEDIKSPMLLRGLWNEVSHLLRLPPVRPAVMTAHLPNAGIPISRSVRPTSSPRTIGLGLRRLVSWPPRRARLRQRNRAG